MAGNTGSLCQWLYDWVLNEWYWYLIEDDEVVTTLKPKENESAKALLLQQYKISDSIMFISATAEEADFVKSWQSHQNNVMRARWCYRIMPCWNIWWSVKVNGFILSWILPLETYLLDKRGVRVWVMKMYDWIMYLTRRQNMLWGNKALLSRATRLIVHCLAINSRAANMRIH